jgi:hypothetical protein
MVEEEAVQRAKARGERLRAELLARLRTGPQSAVGLLPQVETPAVSLPEVSFQLDRLAAEGRAVGERGGSYRLA